MNTTHPTEGLPAIGIKIPKLLVDNLRHISDHGLAVQFADQKLTNLINSLKRDGFITLIAGESHLDIHTIGRVTFTKLFLAHGNYTHRAAHYLDEGANIKYTLKDSDGKDELPFWTVYHVMTGKSDRNRRDGLPHVWSTRTGQAQDELRDYLKNWAWTLAGESGMRAKAIDRDLDILKSNVRSIKGSIDSANYRIRQLNNRNFDDEIASQRLMSKKRLKDSHKNEADVNALMTKAREMLDSGADTMVAGSNVLYALGVRYQQGRWNPEKSRCDYTVYLPETPPETTPPYMRINYTATRDGDNIILSSGIKCEVSCSQVLAWLKGEANPPVTRYGTASLIESSTFEGQPIKLVKCGCHVLDLSSLGDDFKEALVPSHTVICKPGVPRLDFTPENKDAIIERLSATAKSLVEAERNDRREEVESFITLKKSAEKIRDNKEATLAAMNAEAAQLEADLIRAEEEVEAFGRNSPSGDLETLNRAMIMAVNGLAGFRVNNE